MSNNKQTPQEKAKELVKKFYPRATSYSGDKKNQYQNAKECALIAVDEIIKSSPSLPILGDAGLFGEDIELSTDWWHNVRSEIAKKKNNEQQ